MSARAPSSDVAFTATVKAIQTRKGSRAAYEEMEERGGFNTAITPDFAAFIAAQRSFFLATANPDGYPYIQHRGGPPGFVQVLDETTLAFADFKGNRQYITQGNLQDNPRAYIFFIDYMHQRRIKVWGRAQVVENDAALVQKLMPEAYRARPEQAILFKIEAWSANCPQHIPQRFEAEDVKRALEERDERIAALEAELAAIKVAIEGVVERDR